MKKAVCIGINNYPGSANDLQGCVNDANDWAAHLQGRGFDVTVMLDAQATRQNVKNALSSLISATAAGDVAVFTYSGHGTNVLDTSGDEPDTHDEALYVYDGTVIDDEIREILNAIHPQATLVVISDSCFSGTVTRVVARGKPRFVPPAGWAPGMPPTKARKQLLLPEADMPEVLLTGCSDSEYSYDASIDGRPNGAMTYMALKAIKENPQATYAQFYTRLRQLLPSTDYPQSPQLEGSQANKDRPLFEPLAVTPEPEPGPGPEPEPTPEPPGCLQGAWQQIKSLFKS